MERWPKARRKTRREDGFYSFMSYSTRDDEVETIKPFVDEYAHAMRSRIPYVPVFYDGYYIPHGHPRLEDYLAQSIHDSDFTTAFLSPGYSSSSWCGFEWGYSHHLSGLEISSEKPLRHEILQILWKRFERGRDSALFERRCTVDVSDEIRYRDLSGALHKAVDGTLRFLDHMYG